MILISGRIACLDVVDADKALHIGQGQGEEGGVGGADHQRVIAEEAAAGVEGQQDDALALEPLHGLLAKLGELIAVDVLEAGLVGGQIVADAHAVGIAAAHVVLHEVDHGAVLASDNLSLFEDAAAGNGIGHVIAGGVRGAVAQLQQLFLRLGIAAPFGLGNCRLQVLGEDKAVKEGIDEHGNPPFE